MCISNTRSLVLKIILYFKGGNKMNKTQLVSEVATKTGLTKADSEKAVNAVFESMSNALVSGNKIQLIGFGSFEPVTRAARSCRNPKDGTLMTIPETKTVKFKVGKNLKEAVAKEAVAKKKK